MAKGKNFQLKYINCWKVLVFATFPVFRLFPKIISLHNVFVYMLPKHFLSTSPSARLGKLTADAFYERHMSPSSRGRFMMSLAASSRAPLRASAWFSRVTGSVPPGCSRNRRLTPIVSERNRQQGSSSHSCRLFHTSGTAQNSKDYYKVSL